MSFSDSIGGRIILAGYLPVQITLSEAVRAGDLIGYSSGWKRADGNNSIYAELIAGGNGANGEALFTAYRIARISGVSGGTAGGTMYLSDTAGGYAESAGTVSQRVGFMLSATEMLVEPKNIVLVRAEQVAWDDIADVTKGALIIGNASARPSELTAPTASGKLAVATGAGTVAWQNTGVKLSAPDISGVVTAASTLTMPAFTLGDTVTVNNQSFDVGANTLAINGTSDIFTLTSTNDGAAGPRTVYHHVSASPAQDDTIGYESFIGKDSGANDFTYAERHIQIVNPADGSEESRALWYTAVSGAANLAMILSGIGDLWIDRRLLQMTTVTNITTAGNETLTVAHLLGGYITRDPAGGARTDTTDTAANIVGAFNWATVGSSFEFTIENTADAAETITVAGGTDVTISGTATIAQNNSKRFLCVFTNVTSSSEAVTIYSLGTIVT